MHQLLIDKLADIIYDFSTVADNMHSAVTALQRKDSGVSDDEIGH